MHARNIYLEAEKSYITIFQVYEQLQKEKSRTVTLLPKISRRDGRGQFESTQIRHHKQYSREIRSQYNYENLPILWLGNSGLLDCLGPNVDFCS